MLRVTLVTITKSILFPLSLSEIHHNLKSSDFATMSRPTLCYTSVLLLVMLEVNKPSVFNPFSLIKKYLNLVHFDGFQTFIKINCIVKNMYFENHNAEFWSQIWFPELKFNISWVDLALKSSISCQNFVKYDINSFNILLSL